MLQRFSIPLAQSLFSLCLLLTGCATAPRVTPKLAPLPENITSFGAATKDGWLYVFGGHKGERHDYSVEMVSGSFERLRLNEGRDWERLPASTPGQGLAIVARGNFIYRIGGMAAKNHQGAKQDLSSLPVVQRFDLIRRVWENAPPLPAPRSSHDAAIIGHKLYVAGGWDLRGLGTKPAWFSNAVVLDLSHPQSAWQEFAQPFQRRALALAASGAKLYCIGGMDSHNDPSLAVDIYDTATGNWSKGPDLPSGGPEIKGFACSAISLNNRICVTTLKGDLWRLSLDGQSWETVGHLQQPRLAHRLVTAGKNQLIVLGGEDGEENKVPGLELLSPSDVPVAAGPTSSRTENLTASHQ